MGVKTIEFFVHHEDVRRASNEWDARDLDPDLRDDLRNSLGRMGKLMTRGLDVGLVLDATDTSDTGPLRVRKGEPTVTIAGPVGEIVLFMYGRKEQADVELSGDDAAIDTVRAAEFGI